ncbi:reverse transcriptase domain-containing protein, partial [Tanacetum coccineum]
MSAMANTIPIVTTVTKTATKEKALKETEAAPIVNIQDFYEEHYEDILPVIMDKIHREKRKEVHTRLDFGDNTKRSERTARSTGLATLTRQARLSLARIVRALEITLRAEVVLTNGTLPKAEAVSEVKTAPVASKNHMIIPTSLIGRSPDTGIALMTGAVLRQRGKSLDEEDLAVPWTCEEVDPFTPRIRNFKSSRKTRMPTYDGTGDPEDYVKKFQAAAQVERWAMPTWCHMFNSTLIGTARVWFDELPPESIDGYKDLKAAFLAYFMQQKKYVKDPVEIHNIKQRDGETLEDFMERFKVETGRIKGAHKCMRIFGFMHGVNNPELTKCLNEHILKTMEEMMTVTTAFIQGETVVASKKKGHASWKPQDQSKRHVSERKSNFRGQSREGRGSNRHSTDECMQLKKQIEELVRAGKLSHLIKEIKQGRDQTKNGKKEAPAKDKSLAIYMIYLWHRTTRQKVTQSFARVNEITFPPLTTSKGTEGPLFIEAEIGGHMIHRMYVNGGSSTKVLYEHCFNRLRPEIKSQMVPATTSLTVDGGIVTIRSTILIPAECATVTTSSKEILKEAEVRHENLKIVLHLKFPDQEVAIRGTLSEKGRTELCSLLKENLDIFAWQPSNITGVPRSVAEHQLNIQER